jgi:hypothetical protein
MDLFDPGQLDPSGSPTQIHDFNPGIIDSGPAKGLFWTVHIPAQNVTIDLDDATARMRVDNFALEDYGTLANALLDGPSKPATVFFDIRWSGVSARVEVRDLVLGFAGKFIEDTAHVSWSASVPSTGFTFQSDAASTSTTAFAEIGAERNGVFFS